jgi:GDP-L-fucose synthase
MGAALQKDSIIYVAGHRGLVGSAICRKLKQQGYGRLLVRSHAELDLTDSVAVRAFFERERPNHVILAAAKVG